MRKLLIAIAIIGGLASIALCAGFGWDQATVLKDQIINVLQLGRIALAIGALLQALPRGLVGSRLLAPSAFTGIYFAPSLVAVKVGGMPLVWGMTIFAGCAEMAVSLVWRRLRAFVPPESAGLVVFFIGSIISLAACHMLLGEGPTGIATLTEWLVAGTTLALMVAIHIWSRTALKIYCVMIGMVFGFIVCIWAGLLTRTDLTPILVLPVISIPTLSNTYWTFDWSMLLPFAITALAAAMSLGLMGFPARAAQHREPRHHRRPTAARATPRTLAGPVVAGPIDPPRNRRWDNRWASDGAACRA